MLLMASLNDSTSFIKTEHPLWLEQATVARQADRRRVKKNKQTNKNDRYRTITALNNSSYMLGFSKITERKTKKKHNNQEDYDSFPSSKQQLCTRVLWETEHPHQHHLTSCGKTGSSGLIPDALSLDKSRVFNESVQQSWTVGCEWVNCSKAPFQLFVISASATNAC